MKFVPSLHPFTGPWIWMFQAQMLPQLNHSQSRPSWRLSQPWSPSTIYLLTNQVQDPNLSAVDCISQQPTGKITRACLTWPLVASRASWRGREEMFLSPPSRSPDQLPSMALPEKAGEDPTLKSWSHCHSLEWSESVWGSFLWHCTSSRHDFPSRQSHIVNISLISFWKKKYLQYLIPPPFNLQKAPRQLSEIYHTLGKYTKRQHQKKSL